MAAARRCRDDGRPVLARRDEARRRLHRSRHALLRPDRRDPVRAREHRAPRRGAAPGARIVHSCGFDSIPSDLGVLLLHDAARRARPRRRSSSTALKGGPSGGTLASMKGQIDEMPAADKALRKIVFDPYSLGGDRPADDATCARSARDQQLGWIGPFVMATYNTRIVRRSHALARTTARTSATARSRRYNGPGHGRSASPPASARSPAAWPSARPASCSTACCPTPAKGRARRPASTASSGSRSTAPAHQATVAAKGDPGYAATAVMMGESALTPRARPPGSRRTRRAHPGLGDGHPADRAPARRGDDPRDRCK